MEWITLYLKNAEENPDGTYEYSMEASVIVQASDIYAIWPSTFNSPLSREGQLRVSVGPLSHSSEWGIYIASFKVEDETDEEWVEREEAIIKRITDQPRVTDYHTSTRAVIESRNNLAKMDEE